MTFVNPNIPALKYRRDIESEVFNCRIYQKLPPGLHYFRMCLVLDETMPYIGASPDQLMTCPFCGKACIEIKCAYSINYNEPNELNPHDLYKDRDTLKLRQNHKYFT